MLELTDDERGELGSVARRLLAERSASASVRALLDTAAGYDLTLWSSMVELGWPAIHLPPDHAGMGASYSDLAVVLHELGRQVTPSPMLASAVLGAEALMGASNSALAGEMLSRLASGEILLTAALSNVAGSYEPTRLTTRWADAGGAVKIDGVSRFVPDAHIADSIVVAAGDGTGTVTMALVNSREPGVTVEVEPVFDRTRRLARVTLDGVLVGSDRLLTEPGAAVDLYRRVVSVGAIAVVCDAVGAAERILETATRYAKERIQFNRPIGSFQAIKHYLADMFTDVEASRAAAGFACDVLDRGGDARHAAAVASSFAGPACARVAGQALQVHGGIGFTWEHDVHLVLKRTRLDEALFGTAKAHRAYLATLLLDEEAAAFM